MVQRLTSAVGWATWLNTMTYGMFWTICGVLCLYVVILFYLKQRFGIGTAVISATVAITFIAMLLYFLGLISQTLMFICVFCASVAFIALWVGG